MCVRAPLSYRGISERNSRVTQQSSHPSPLSDETEQVSPAPIVSDTNGISRRGLLKGAAVGAASLGALGGLALPPGVAAAASPTTTASIASAPAIVEFPRGGALREYWFQADSFFHNIVPTGVDGQTGNTFMANQTSLWAVGFRAFTPGWGKPLPGNDD